MKANTVEGYRDCFGVICQADLDGGDSLNRTGVYHAALHVLGFGTVQQRQEECLRDLNRITLNIPIGRYRRHPDITRWYCNINTVTRDQMAPAECAMVLNKLRGHLNVHLALRIKRGLFHFSTVDTESNRAWKFPDPPSPSELAVIIRGSFPWLSFLLPLLDIQLILDLLLLKGNKKHDGQFVAFAAVACQNKTPMSWLIRKVLKYKLDALKKEIRAYHLEEADNNGIEPLGELLCDAAEVLSE